MAETPKTTFDPWANRPATPAAPVPRPPEEPPDTPRKHQVKLTRTVKLTKTRSLYAR